MKKKRKVEEPKEQKSLLEKLYKKTHNWFEIKVYFDHLDPHEDGRPNLKWHFKDCRGYELVTEDLETMEMILGELKRI